jgi:hypothetical protein
LGRSYLLLQVVLAMAAARLGYSLYTAKGEKVEAVLRDTHAILTQGESLSSSLLAKPLICIIHVYSLGDPSVTSQDMCASSRVVSTRLATSIVLQNRPHTLIYGRLIARPLPSGVLSLLTDAPDGH